MDKQPYGKELILDLHDCDITKFTREKLNVYFFILCNAINMNRADLHWWDYDGQQEEYHLAEDHLKGTSAIQFIMTSNITIHTLDVLKRIYINIFSCKDFNPSVVEKFTVNYFRGNTANKLILDRI